MSYNPGANWVDRLPKATTEDSAPISPRTVPSTLASQFEDSASRVSLGPSSDTGVPGRLYDNLVPSNVDDVAQTVSSDIFADQEPQDADQAFSETFSELVQPFDAWSWPSTSDAAWPLNTPLIPETPSDRSLQRSTSSRARGSKQLLRRFYQIPSAVPRPLQLEATRLVEHYFSGICSLYSCFDSPLNPFRTSVSRHLQLL